MDHPRRTKKGNRSWIAVDVDGVLADHVSHILPVLKRDYGFDTTISQIRTWDFPVASTTFGAILRAAQMLPDFVRTTPVVPGAPESMRKLSESYNLAIVTARPRESTDATQKWLRANDIVFDDFANLSEGTKHGTAYSCDILIDDYAVNVTEFLRNTNGHAILFSRPWNIDPSDRSSFMTINRLHVADNWQEVLGLITDIL